MSHMGVALLWPSLHTLPPLPDHGIAGLLMPQVEVGPLCDVDLVQTPGRKCESWHCLSPARLRGKSTGRCGRIYWALALLWARDPGSTL